MGKTKSFRLKKGPDIEDYVVETIARKSSGGVIQEYQHFQKRDEARKFAKDSKNAGVRARTFHISYKMVGDTK